MRTLKTTLSEQTGQQHTDDHFVDCAFRRVLQLEVDLAKVKLELEELKKDYVQLLEM